MSAGSNSCLGSRGATGWSSVDLDLASGLLHPQVGAQVITTGPVCEPLDVEGGAMPSIFVNWNPRLNSWVEAPNFAWTVEQARRGRTTVIEWTARDTSAVAVGVTVYFMHHDGGEPVGILGSGTVSGETSESASWDPKRPGTATYIPIRMESMVPIEHELSVSEVARILPGAEWPRIPSGVPIPDAIAAQIASSWAHHWELVLHRSCPFCGGTDIAVEPAPPLTDVAHRCVTCGYLWGAHPAEPIVSGPGDLPALLECNIQDIEVCIREMRDEPDLRIIRNDDRQLALDTAEGEVVFDYPFLGGPFRNLVYCDWLSWHGDAGDISEPHP